MASTELKALVVAHMRHDDTKFRHVVDVIIAQETQKNHLALASDLRRIIGTKPVAAAVLLPVDKDSRLNLVNVRQPNRPLAGVILSPETRAKVDEVITEVRHGEQLDEAGIPRRNRVLLYGPPGCGKTTTVEAIATELGRPLVVARLSELIGGTMGRTSSNLAALFAYMSTGEYVVLLDEFDSIGKSRADKQQDVGEMRRVVNSLLQLIDAYDGPSLIVAATNYEDILDAALWRRFDTIAEMPLPSREQLEGVIRKHVGADVSPEMIMLTAIDLKGYSHAAAEYLGLGAPEGPVRRPDCRH